MYTDMKTILDDAVKHHYAVLAGGAFNMETIRGLIGAADAEQAPVLILMGQNMIKRHGHTEITAPMVRQLASETNVPVALLLDHGRDWDMITQTFRAGFNSMMIDASAYDMQENIARTKKVVDLCHAQGVPVEGELGHVGVAATLDGCDESLYTKPEEVQEFLQATGVDCLAIACGTAHGKYSDGLVPKLKFVLIRTVRAMTNVPLALHGTSGAGDENIRKAVEAGINKVNVATEIFCGCRDFMKQRMAEDPDIEYLQLCVETEAHCKELCRHFIRLTGSSGMAAHFAPRYDFTHSVDRSLLDQGE